MEKNEYTQKRAALTDEIRRLHKDIEDLDNEYCEYLEQQLAARGIKRGTPIMLYGQPCIFHAVKQKLGSVVIAVHGELKGGGMTKQVRHSVLNDINEISVREKVRKSNSR